MAVHIAIDNVVDLLVHSHFSRVVNCQFAQRNALPVIGRAFFTAASSTDTAFVYTCTISRGVQCDVAGTALNTSVLRTVSGRTRCLV